MIIGVTGANGFIGKHLCHQLKTIGHQVIKVDLPDGNVKDINTLDLLRNAEIIFHLAVVPLNECNNEYQNCIKTNITGTANVMTIAKAYGIKKVIMASASSVYGDPAKLPVCEDHPTNPLTIYGATKLAGEHIMRIMSQNFNLTYGIFRFTNVYGPGQQTGIIPVVINSLLKDRVIEIEGTGEQSRDFVYIDDVVLYLMAAIHQPIYSFTSNLGSGTHTSINKIVSGCSGYMNISARVKAVPAKVDRRHFVAGLHKLNTMFDKHELTCFEDGLAKTIEWWKNESGN